MSEVQFFNLSALPDPQYTPPSLLTFPSLDPDPFFSLLPSKNSPAPGQTSQQGRHVASSPWAHHNSRSRSESCGSKAFLWACLERGAVDSGDLVLLPRRNVLWPSILGSTVDVLEGRGCVLRTGGVGGPSWSKRGGYSRWELHRRGRDCEDI